MEVVVSASDIGPTNDASSAFLSLLHCCVIALKTTLLTSAMLYHLLYILLVAHCNGMGFELLVWRRVLALLIERRGELLLVTLGPALCSNIPMYWYPLKKQKRRETCCYYIPLCSEIESTYAY